MMKEFMKNDAGSTPASPVMPLSSIGQTPRLRTVNSVGSNPIKGILKHFTKMSQNNT